jgi:hypothetical protein
MLGHNTGNLESEAFFADSFLVRGFVRDFLQQDDVAAYETLKNTKGVWTDREDMDFHYRGRALPRTKAFFVQADAGAALDAPPDVVPIYTYPGFQYGSIEFYRPFQAVPLVQALVGQVEQLTFNDRPVRINHVIGTHYITETDNISAHHDKTDNITPDTPIISISFGETRVMRMESSDGEEVLDIVLRPGDLFVLGPRTNEQYTHAIIPVAQEDEQVIQRDPNEPIGGRISLVFRSIAKHMSLANVRAKAGLTKQRRASKAAGADAKDGEISARGVLKRQREGEHEYDWEQSKRARAHSDEIRPPTK